MCQLLPNTSDGFPEIENQEWIQGCHSWNQKCFTQGESCIPDLKQEKVHEAYHFPESYCDPPHEEEAYVDPPHEWD